MAIPILATSAVANKDVFTVAVPQWRAYMRQRCEPAVLVL